VYINYLLSDGKCSAKSVYYLHSQSVNDRRHSLKLILKFRYGTFSVNKGNNVVLVCVMCRRHQYIGKAKYIEYMTAGHSAARIIVGTEQNVIAAISGHNGHIGETSFLSFSILQLMKFVVLLVSSVSANNGVQL